MSWPLRYSLPPDSTRISERIQVSGTSKLVGGFADIRTPGILRRTGRDVVVLGMGDVTGGFLSGIRWGATLPQAARAAMKAMVPAARKRRKCRAIKCDHQRRLRGGATNKMTRRLTSGRRLTKQSGTLPNPLTEFYLSCKSSRPCRIPGDFVSFYAAAHRSKEISAVSKPWYFATSGHDRGTPDSQPNVVPAPRME